jgi:phosphoribosylformylglycinamidine cyclo-ligase
MDEDPLTYASAGVDVAASEAATAALVSTLSSAAGDYAGLVDVGDGYLGLTTDGVGTKLLVAAAVDDHSTVGIDCIAMNVNDLVAAGVKPLAFVDYLAVDEPDEATSEEIGKGLATGAERANVSLVGGETAVMPEVVTGLDLAGAAVGVAGEDDLLDGTPAPGDLLVGVRSTGIHSNGLTLAREAVTRDGEYNDPFPADPDQTVGEALLEPTAVYTDLLDPAREYASGAAHITGGGWTNLERMGDRRYVVEDAFDPQPVFDYVQACGNVDDEEMYRTFNMGTGFVLGTPVDRADTLADAVDGRVIGRVEEGSGISVASLEL